MKGKESVSADRRLQIFMLAAMCASDQQHYSKSNQGSMKRKSCFKKSNLKPVFNYTSNKAFTSAVAKAELAECDLCLAASFQVKASRSFQQSTFCLHYRLQGLYVAGEDLPVALFHIPVTMCKCVIHSSVSWELWHSLSPVTEVLVPVKI